MNTIKEELRTVRMINAMMLNKIHKLSNELEMEKELHFDTIERLSYLQHSIDYMSNTKKPF